MISWIKKLFTKREKLVINSGARTIPEGFGYPEPEFQALVNELTGFIEPNDRLVSLVAYLENDAFTKYKLNINTPNDAAVLGYAFCVAVMKQRQIQADFAARKALDMFYPASKGELN